MATYQVMAEEAGSPAGIRHRSHDVAVRKVFSTYTIIESFAVCYWLYFCNSRSLALENRRRLERVEAVQVLSPVEITRMYPYGYHASGLYGVL